MNKNLQKLYCVFTFTISKQITRQKVNSLERTNRICKEEMSSKYFKKIRKD